MFSFVFQSKVNGGWDCTLPLNELALSCDVSYGGWLSSFKVFDPLLVVVYNSQ